MQILPEFSIDQGVICTQTEPELGESGILGLENARIWGAVNLGSARIWINFRAANTPPNSKREFITRAKMKVRSSYDPKLCGGLLINTLLRDKGVILKYIITSSLW